MSEMKCFTSNERTSNSIKLNKFHMSNQRHFGKNRNNLTTEMSRTYDYWSCFSERFHQLSLKFAMWFDAKHPVVLFQ